MAKLAILHYPDSRLNKVGMPVVVFDQRLRALTEDMAETMYAAPGIGLAATQVDVHERVIVIDTSETRDDLKVFVNPRIVARSGVADREEGCLSVPGVFDKVSRAERITVEAQDVSGNSYTLEAEGLLAVCIQHEIDHLEGKVFVEYLSRLKRERIATRMRKQQRLAM
jgi:peptide deformylase